MKILKRLFCLMIMIPVMFVFSACGKKDSDKNSNNKDSNPSDSSSAVSKISETSKILGVAYDDFIKNATHKIEDTNELAAKTDAGYVYKSYNEFILAGFSIFKVLSEYENLPEDVWCYSDEVALENKTDYANRLLKFFVSSEQVEKNIEIKIYMMFGIVDTDITEKENTYNLVSCKVVYYQEVESVKVDMMIEKSRNNLVYGVEDSKADYYFISYTNWEILATSFSRAREVFDIDDLDEITNRLITKYSSLNYCLALNVQNHLIDGFVMSMASMRKDVQDRMKNMMDVYEYVSSSDNVAETKIEGLMEKLVKIVNAKKISDFQQ